MTKIVLAQIDPIAGDIIYNSEKIKQAILKAKDAGASLIIFPELALFGYPFGDIFIRHKPILTLQDKKLKEITKLTKGITALVGYVEATNKKDKKPYYNSIAVLQNGKKIDNIRKILLPSYCEFNDNRYFEPADKTGNLFEADGVKYGVLICEDSFNDKEFFEENIYKIDPLNDLIKKKPDVIINCSSSPSRARKEQFKNSLFSAIAKKHKIKYVYVNQAGYGDSLCFDGASRIYDERGKLTLCGKFFEEDFITADDFKGKIEKLPKGLEFKSHEIKKFSIDYAKDLDRTYKAIICAVRGYFKKTGFKKAVLGLSGGLDSSVCAVLLADALGKENVWGISMPSKITTGESKHDAEILANNLGINFLEVPIGEMTTLEKDKLQKAFDKIKTERYEKSTTFENVQARLRAIILWSTSNEFKSMLPIATSDKSELYIGYATINGDMSGGFAPIADVTKTKLFALADFLNTNREFKNAIPKAVLEKRPGAELKLGKDGRPVCAEDENMPYVFLDEIIWYVENYNYGFSDLMKHNFKYEEENNLSLEQKEEWITKFYKKSQAAIYKWQLLPPSVIIDAKSINNLEYHHPIVSKYNFKMV